VFGETHTSRAPVAHTGNAAKPSPGIGIIGSASVRMFDDSRIAAIARDEFLLAATAQNLRKLAKLIPLPTLQPA
jgi:hypothetical protein